MPITATNRCAVHSLLSFAVSVPFLAVSVPLSFRVLHAETAKHSLLCFARSTFPLCRFRSFVASFAVPLCGFRCLFAARFTAFIAVYIRYIFNRHGYPYTHIPRARARVYERGHKRGYMGIHARARIRVYACYAFLAACGAFYRVFSLRVMSDYYPCYYRRLYRVLVPFLSCLFCGICGKSGSALYSMLIITGKE